MVIPTCDSCDSTEKYKNGHWKQKKGETKILFSLEPGQHCLNEKRERVSHGYSAI
jgi:hypothetical protein